MNYQKKYPNFTKVSLISIVVAMMMCIGLSAQVMADPVQVQVVDIFDSDTIMANPGEAVDIYIRLDNVEEYYEDLSDYDPPFDPDDPDDAEALEKLRHQIQAIQFVFTYDPSALEINTDVDGNPIVEAFGVTEDSDTLEAWPVSAEIIEDIDGNPIGELNVCLSMNPVDPNDPNWSKDLYDDPDADPDLTWNPSEIYSLSESGKGLFISANVDENASGDYLLTLEEIQQEEIPEETIVSLAILNEKDKDTGEDIIPSEIVPGTLSVILVCDTTPPVWDDTIGVQEVTPGPNQLTASWGTATDADSPPVTYNLYYRDGTPVFDGPDTPHLDTIKLEDVTSPYTITGLTPEVEYCIVVRAQDSPEPSCEPNEDENVEELCGIPNPSEIKKYFTMTIQPDINMVSIPLDPGEPWTLEEFLEKVQGDYMFYWDGSNFQYYGGGTTTIPAEGGVGYVVVRDISAPPIEVTFEGVAWSNTSKPELVSEGGIQSETKTLEVVGHVFDENNQPVGAGYMVVITNIDKPEFTKTTTTDDNGYYADALFHMFDPVVETGDVIQVVATTPDGTESAENTEIYESGNSMTIDVYFPKTRYFEVIFEPDINVIGVPLDPEEPWTLKELLTSIPANYMFYYDAPDFIYYGGGDTSVPVEGGVGYVAVCDPEMEPVEHIYEGVAWENTGPPVAPLLVFESANAPHTSVFAVVGQIQQLNHGELDGLSLRLYNSRTKQTVSTKPAKDGSYHFVFFDLWNRDVIAAGDSLVVTIEDANRIYQSETFEIVTDVKDIQNHRVILKPIQLYPVPKETKLLANYPNPFNPETWIPYQLSQDSHVTIRIYDLSGRLVRLLNLGRRPAGHYVTPPKAVYWNGTNQLGEHVASGVYFYTLQADRFVATRKLLIVK